MKNKKVFAFGIAGILGLSVALPALSGFYSANSYAISVTDIPVDVVSAKIKYFNSEWNEKKTNATVKVENGNADIKNMTESGYYTIIFSDLNYEIGSAEFFLGDSGSLYSYDYIYDESSQQYLPEYHAISSIGYEANSSFKALSVDDGISVKINDVPNEVKSVNIFVEIDDTHYGEAEKEVKVNSDGSILLSDIGKHGNYTIDFYGDGEFALGYATFYINENKELCSADVSFNQATNKWDTIYIPNDTFYFVYYADSEIGISDNEETDNFSVTISDVPKSVSNVEIQYLTEDMTSAESFADVQINSDGTIIVNNLWSGYYTLNCYDSQGNVTGYSTFYMDSDGIFYTYDKSTSVSVPKYKSFKSEEEYKKGNLSVCIYDVPEEIDSVEARYLYGEEEDEAIWFEPEISSTYVSPLKVSGFGTTGNYKLYFYENGDIVGYADFYLDSEGRTYYVDSVYNTDSKKWENTLVETNNVYYYVNNDIESADDYSYGNTKVTITNVPADVKYVEVIDYESDSTYTAGTPVFPDTNLNGKGTAVISNFGESGYYEIDLIKSDAITKAGYIFIYIDNSMNVYLIEYNINPDTYQIETTRTRTNVISLTPYLSSTIDYVYGKNSVSISRVPLTVNNIFATCTTSDGSYSSFKNDISVNEKGIAVIKNLGSEGEYTISFMNDKNYLGSASFYLKSDGTICEATYKYNNDGTISTALSPLSEVAFKESDANISYEKGDMDFSGSITVSDIVIMQKYLLSVQTINASQYYIADVNNDSTVNVFDIIYLKNMLLKN